MSFKTANRRGSKRKSKGDANLEVEEIIKRCMDFDEVSEWIYEFVYKCQFKVLCPLEFVGFGKLIWSLPIITVNKNGS